VHSATPSTDLRGYIRAYAQREVVATARDLVQPIHPFLEHVLVFEFHDRTIVHFTDGKTETAFPISLVGCQISDSSNLRFSGRVESFAVFFHPLALAQLFGRPTAKLFNQAFDGSEALHNGLSEVWMKLAEAPAFQSRVRIMDAYLRKRAESSRILTAIPRSAAFLFENHGTIAVREMAFHAALSLRQYERRFLDEMGFSPKRFARVARFQSALDAKVISPGTSWLKIAHGLGYSDQMHMIHDFRALSGEPPDRTWRRMGDNRPSALASAASDDEVAGWQTEIFDPQD
jgi:AraC-like DNA-binding protein